MSRTLPYLWYPVATLLAIWGFGILLAAHVPLPVATYAPIAGVALIVVLLEWRFPERLDWRPKRPDILADAAFMAFVQVLLPRLLAVVAVLAIGAWVHANHASLWWPHAWPLAVQVLLMVLGVDFLRYWLHRACHRFGPLWRLHEVHHSPDVLYALNVGRFHPLEKLLHFSCDTVPFLLLGVAPEVIAGYFVLYAVNGLFQHSNVHVRYGWLNYLVGSAETHRWHHARDPVTGHCNFGNTTIVWDLLFGTWRLPYGISGVDIGIPDREYPKGFFDQLLMPFRRRTGGLVASLTRRFADVVVPLQLRFARWFHGRRVATMARRPMRTQDALLRQILRENAATTFGRQHGFAGITSHGDFATAVPVSEFEAVRPCIDAEIERGESALTQAAPLCYMRTSGSTGRPKDVPLTAKHLRGLRRIQRMSVAFQHGVCREAFTGSILAIVSPAEEGRLANGKSFGAASGIVAGGTPRIVKEKMVVPIEAHAVADPRVKYLLILRLAIARGDVTYFGAANPTTPLAMMKLYREHQSQLVADVRSGGFFLNDALPPGVRVAVAPRLFADPRRADELERLDAGDGGPTMADLWPSLAMVVTWTCGSAGIAVGALRRELSRRTRIFELGYVASEFRGTFTLGRREGTGFPTLDTHFFEFVERERWDRGEREFLTLDRLRKGGEYYVIVTTRSGLYRYFINDLVRVTGRLHATPLLKFLQKGRGVTSITGEKLYESQALAAVRGALGGLNLVERFVMVLADEVERVYRVYVEIDGRFEVDGEAFSLDVDARLCRSNVEYRDKRASERLGAPVIRWLKSGTGEAFKQHYVRKGQREGQFKTVALTFCKDVDFDLEAHSQGS